MGVGISRVVAGSGIAVFLCEKDTAAAGNTRQALSRELEHEMSRWALTEPERQAICRRIRIGVELSEAASADLVIETVTENFELKTRLFAELDTLCGGEIIFVSNTSTLSVSELAAVTQRPTASPGCISSTRPRARRSWK
jgi:3-hydroxybutyryl-CoA dehydrogenase